MGKASEDLSSSRKADRSIRGIINAFRSQLSLDVHEKLICRVGDIFDKLPVIRIFGRGTADHQA